MGGGKWSTDAYVNIKRSYAKLSTDDVFTTNRTNAVHDDMSPIGVNMRESRDSDEHPASLAIMVFLDETGSMGRIPEKLAREKLGALLQTLIDHGIEHPQVLFGGVGDHRADRYPLQVGQFESSTELIDKCLTSIFLEGNGGGQNRESYPLAWLFAARNTSIDCFEKRGQKGFLFTIGDEGFWETMEKEKLSKILGTEFSEDVSALDLLEEVQQKYHVYHIHINEASYRDDPQVLGQWRKALGERVIVLNDYTATAETIASTVAIMHGVDLEAVTSTFDDKTASVVTTALANVNTSIATKSEGVIKL